MVNKNFNPTKLLWVDLEMTGLEPSKDVLLEIAIEITDFDFKTLAGYESRIRQKREVVVNRMAKNIWWRDFPENRNSFLEKLEESKPIKEVENEVIALIEKHFGGEPAVLAGNSIYNDRLFIKQWMPALELKLHYRMLDVSSFKILMQGKYGEKFEKQEVHRAFDDIQASIAELQHYLEWFKNNKESLRTK